jgi:hypothetical protein
MVVCNCEFNNIDNELTIIFVYRWLCVTANLIILNDIQRSCIGLTTIFIFGLLFNSPIR